MPFLEKKLRRASGISETELRPLKDRSTGGMESSGFESLPATDLVFGGELDVTPRGEEALCTRLITGRQTRSWCY